MDPTAIRELIALESSQMDASFEYWLAASFAVVVAGYSARHSMSRFAKLMLSGAYLIFTVGTLIKFAADASEIFQMNELLVGTQLDADTLWNRLAAQSRVAMYVIFSGVVVAFVFSSNRIFSEDKQSD